MERYIKKFKEDKLKESIYPSKFDDIISSRELDSLQSLADTVVEIVWKKLDFFINREDIKFDAPKTTFEKIPLAGSSLFSISFKEEANTKCYGSYNVYTPTGLLNSHSEIVRWIELFYPTEETHYLIKVILK